ncbi:hypothetical protein [Corynebacterium sp.]|uniref:hypothetical protein n=1 Tax=Corynebacterium sp. TaxID=1720 RepID=UPI0026DEE72B|nr:hypothetical protein [Corynebacterium sp.]MDO5512806.1 hypothetical protein [Corynebacterium sp.]
MSISRKASNQDEPDRPVGQDVADEGHRAHETTDQAVSGNLPTPEQMADPGDLADPNQPSPDTPPA